MNEAKDHTTAYARYLELRYREAYDDAKELRKFGSLTKVASFIIAGVVGLAIPTYYSMIGTSGEFGQGASHNASLFVNWVLAGIGCLAVFYIIGTVICGMSDILKATTDASINTSPMLSNEQKAEIVLHKVLTHESIHHKIDREINA